MTNQEKKYFFVDLDGTFAQNDLFQELVVKHFVQKPFDIVNAYLKGGVLSLKHLVFDKHQFSIDQIIVNREVLKLIQQKREHGYEIFLTTASPQVYACYVLKTWSIFDLAKGSSQIINLKGQAKLDFILSIAEGTAFEYVGDSKADQIIFSKCVRYYKIINNQVYEFAN